MDGTQASAAGRGGCSRALLCALSAAALGYALEQRDGALEASALVAVSLALFALAAAALAPRALDGLGAAREGALAKLLGPSGAKLLLSALVLLQLALQFARPPGIDLRPLRFGPWPFWIGILVAFATIAAGLWLDASRARTARLARLRWPFLLALHFALCLWMLRASPAPQIDVFLFHRAGFSALLEGKSPYASAIPLLYGDARYYGAGLVQDGVVRVGHPYPPLSFALTFLAWFVCGDYRLALALALTLSGACIAALARGTSENVRDPSPSPPMLGQLCALLFLFSPRTFFVLEQGWTEPLVLAFACALALAVTRAPRSAPWLLAGLVAVKQYGFFALPLLPLLYPDESRPRLARRALFAAAVALAVSLPLALTAPRAFIDSVLLFQVRQPFRPDALSFAAELFQFGGPALPGWVSFAALFFALALALRFSPRAEGPGPFLAALAFASALFFDVGKQAFANSHFLVLALSAAAASALSCAERNNRGRERLTGSAPAD